MITIKDITPGTKVSVNRNYFPNLPIGTLGTVQKHTSSLWDLLVVEFNGINIALPQDENYEIVWLDIVVKEDVYWKKKIQKATEISKKNDFEVYDEEFWSRQPAGVISLLIKASGNNFPYVIEIGE